eukprot:m.180610 g.180610  ORF g.180610 m.180610 type:complete len:174 (-) comp15046_c0_seq1:359-880(-)
MTEMYDNDHNVSDLDRARSAAMLADQAEGHAHSSSERFESMMEGMEETIRGVLEALLAQANAGGAADSSVATSATYLADLAEYKPSKEDLDAKLECPVCLQHFAAEDTMHVLPCYHTFHPDCCMPWLRQHNTCPVCRHELPSDDPRWEEQKRQQKAQADRENDLSQLHNAMFG